MQPRGLGDAGPLLHGYVEELLQLAMDEGAPPAIRDALATAMAELGIRQNDESAMNRAAEAVKAFRAWRMDK